MRCDPPSFEVFGRAWRPRLEVHAEPAFFVGATVRSLSIGLENTTAAESVIRDADFAFETADLTRNQILAASAQQILGLANSQPQSALQLLG